MADDTPAGSDKQRDGKPVPPHLWKPGQSGNPRGRLPYERTLTSCLRDQLADLDPEMGRTYEQLLAEAVVKGAIKAAGKGNGQLAQFIFERLEGKMPELIDLRAIEIMASKDIANMTLDELDAYDFQLQGMIKKLAPHGLPALLPAPEEDDTPGPGTVG